MASLRASNLFTSLVIGICLVLASAQDTGDALKDHSTQQTTAKYQLLAAPLYRNVTAGQAWVYPSSPFELGGRSMSCECFNANDECCMPKSTSLAPFCMPIGSSCCADTFCVAGETCCGEFCCAANTICNIKTTGSGCCPIGALCSSPAICYDHASSNCIKTSDPKQQCCPSNLPFCRDFPPIGRGCYASSTMSSASTTVPGMTAAATSGVFPEPTMTPSAFSSTVTVTVSVVSNGGSLVLEFPTSSVGGALESTKYILDYGSSSVIPLPVDTSTVLPGLTATVTSTIVTVSSTPSSTSSSPPPSPPPSLAAPSTLCFNTALQTPAPCPSTTTSTSSSGNPLVTTLPIAGATAKSQASRSLNPITSTETFQLVMGLPAVCLTGMILGVLLFQIYDWIRGCMRRRREAPTLRETVMRTRADDISEINETRMGERDIRVVRESGRRLSSASRLDREITVVTGSARPYKEPVVVDKTAIRVVEGSARPLDNDVLLGQEKLVEKGKDEKASLGHVLLGARENA